MTSWCEKYGKQSECTLLLRTFISTYKSFLSLLFLLLKVSYEFLISTIQIKGKSYNITIFWFCYSVQDFDILQFNRILIYCITFQNTIPGNIYYQHQNASLHSNATIETTHQTNTNMASLGRIESKPNTNNNRHPKINLAFADRLKPTCSQRSSMSSESSIHGIQATDSSDIGSSWRIRAERSRNNPHGSPTQHRAKAIIRKYRRHVRHVEFKRLRSIVPAVAGNEKASQVGHFHFVTLLNNITYPVYQTTRKTFIRINLLTSSKVNLNKIFNVYLFLTNYTRLVHYLAIHTQNKASMSLHTSI